MLMTRLGLTGAIGKTMKRAIQRIIEARQSGLITESEAQQNLDCYNVRGAFRDDQSFIGYDYSRQEWIDTAVIEARTEEIKAINRAVWK